MIYRVEIRKDGTVVSCEPVEVARLGGVSVFYVDAQNKAEACKSAKLSFARAAAKREARLAQGLCRCGAMKAVTEYYCRDCRKKRTDDHRISESIRRGEFPEAEANARRLALHQKRVEMGRRGANLSRTIALLAANERWDRGETPSNARSVLRQCLRAYDTDPASFRNWLLARLDHQEATAAE